MSYDLTSLLKKNWDIGFGICLRNTKQDWKPWHATQPPTFLS